MAEMTPEERAEAVFKECATSKWGDIQNAIGEQIRAAVQAEREACAKILEHSAVFYKGTDPYGLMPSKTGEPVTRVCAAAIRAREG